jgi:hypothetical protein
MNRPFSTTAIEPQRETHRLQYPEIRFDDCSSAIIMTPLFKTTKTDSCWNAQLEVQVRLYGCCQQF